MIQRAEQANIVGLRSKDFVQWVEENIDAPIKRGPGGAILERLKAGLVGEFFNWAKRNSTWPLHFGIMCCAIEMAATSDPRYDVERFGVIYRSSPRQCDVLLLNGPISLKLRPAVRRLYEQMAEPKWVIAMGECTICGGPYYDSYSVVKGSYTFVPTDIFIPGCPVRPEALIDGFLKLSAKIIDLRAQLEESVDECLRTDGPAGDEDVRGHERVRALDHRVRVVVRTAANRALPHRDDPLGFRHLLVQPAHGGAELQGDRAVQEEDVALPRGRAVDDAEPLDVVPRIRGRRHLDRAAHDAEVQRPGGVPFRPVEELPDEATFESLEDGPAGTAFHRGVDVLLDPLYEVLRAEADDVRLFRALDHPIRTPEMWPATRSRDARISGPLLN